MRSTSEPVQITPTQAVALLNKYGEFFADANGLDGGIDWAESPFGLIIRSLNVIAQGNRFNRGEHLSQALQKSRKLTDNPYLTLAAQRPNDTTSSRGILGSPYHQPNRDPGVIEFLGDLRKLDKNPSATLSDTPMQFSVTPTAVPRAASAHRVTAASASIFPPAPPSSNPLIIGTRPSSALPNYGYIGEQTKISNQELKDMWASILKTNTNYDPTKDLLIHSQGFDLVLQNQMLTTYLRQSSTHPRGREIVEARQSEVEAQLKALAAGVPSATSRGAGASATASREFKQDVRANIRPSISENDLLKAIITHFCVDAGLQRGQQAPHAAFTFGVSQSSNCPYIANARYQILLDKDQVVVLDRQHGFTPINHPTQKNGILNEMLGLCDRDAAVQSIAQSLRTPDAAASRKSFGF